MTNNQLNPLIQHRRSIRLKGYDYSQRRDYFIIICLPGQGLFIWQDGRGQMMLNDAGTMIDKWWQLNYYEHIIRNEPLYLTISNYIINNPA